MTEVKFATSTQAPHDYSLSSLEDSGWSSVPTVTELSDGDFATKYRDAMRPVLLRSGCAAWSACWRWSPQYFNEIAGELTIPVKTLDHGEIKLSSWKLSEYTRFLTGQLPSADGATLNPRAVPYCHDIPLLGLVESLAEDCQPFPGDYLTPWYRRHWWRYSQFFMGPAGTVTPLHFDTLLSHNLFFQIYGDKQFTILPPSQATCCGRRGWRWFDVDPEQPDYVRFPEYEQATPIVITVSAGDMLYMPPGTLHHVRSLSTSISFNIDFHTKHSVLDALAQSNKGMPAEIVYYNAITALGVSAEIPEDITFPLYRPYLSYVS
ncbi:MULTISPECIES: cupin-like domain-containing protein [unclassified Sinorhizobium]|uniref:cupin-like domain-containing protein n=1 Tax=unclassified Sinorhizobium TaxID=2613772 RepID=UPI0024C46855|nr:MULTISPECIES: cupin-like domain-containing protein [unclassified Sinorhizobium]MDK1378628.1 cupin-like domain-containing protein [Sinorhizobium sp. 6-70]MDK1482411.1 cupin-like domain-containing protein [Sinorhizobium sp. 6-117]